MDEDDEFIKKDKRLKITVITQENSEELLIAFAIYDIKFQIIFQ